MDWIDRVKQLPLGSSRKVDCWHCNGLHCCSLSHLTKGYAFKCFRCQETGFQPVGVLSVQDLQQRREAISKLLEDTTQLVLSLPSGLCPLGENAAACLWLSKAGIPLSLAEKYQWAYHGPSGRACLPLLSPSLKVLAVLFRSLDGSKPKYILKGDKDATFWSRDEFILPSVQQELFSPDVPHACIVEDILSAVRVGRCIRTAALLGTAVSDAKVNELATVVRSLAGDETPRVCVWTDNDPAGHKARVHCIRRLGLQGIEVRIIKTPKDPKYYTNGQIKELIFARSRSAEGNEV